MTPVHYSQLTCAQRCWRRWLYGHYQQLSGTAQRSYFAMGSSAHHLLARYFGKPAPEDDQPSEEPHLLTYLDQDNESVTIDLDAWSREWIQAWHLRAKLLEVPLSTDAITPIAVEQELQAVLPCGIVLAGTSDLIVELPNGGHMIIDHKTCASLPKADWYMHMDLQGSLYCLLAALNGYPVETAFAYHYVTRDIPPPPTILKSTRLSTNKRTRTDQIAVREWLETANAEIAASGLADQEEDLTFRLNSEEQAWLDTIPEQKMCLLVQSQRFGDQLTEAWWTADVLAQQIMDRRDLLAQHGIPAMVNEPVPNCLAERTIKRDCSWDCDFRRICVAELEGGDSRELRQEFFVDAARYAVGVEQD